jgi:carboxyl-terminal processing protease
MKRRCSVSLVSLPLFLSFIACAPQSGSKLKGHPGATDPGAQSSQISMSFAEFERSGLATSTVKDSGSQAPCDATCKQRRMEFRYVVYVGKQIYAYWDEKKGETGTDFDALATELDGSITSATSYTEYYLTLRRWAASFHDGHVNVLVKNADTDLEVYTSPVRLEAIAPGTDHEKVIVSQVADMGGMLEKSEIPKVGEEIVEIDGLPVAQAIDAIEKTTSGSTRRMRRNSAVRRLIDATGAVDGSKPLELRLGNAGKTRKISLFRTAELMPRAPENAPAPAETTGYENFRAQILPGGLGYLRIDAFLGSQSSFLLEQAMARLQKTSGLLIDVRRNGGGDPSGNSVLARLITGPITRYRTSERMSDFMISSRPESFFLPWNPGETFARWHDLKVSPLMPSDFYGHKPVIALTGARCFSACDTFVSALQTNHLATIVGEPTGGGTGTPLVFELPYSKQSFRYSVVRGLNADGKAIEGAGTTPDTLLEPTVEERANGVDAQLLRALAMLETQVRGRAEAPPSPALGGSGQPLAGSVGAEGSTAKAPGGMTSGSGAGKAALAAVASELGPSWAQPMEVSPIRAENRELSRLWDVDEIQPPSARDGASD